MVFGFTDLIVLKPTFNQVIHLVLIFFDLVFRLDVNLFFYNIYRIQRVKGHLFKCACSSDFDLLFLFLKLFMKIFSNIMHNK